MTNGWTEEELATLRRLKGEGMRAEAISKVLGRTRNAVIGKLHRFGLTDPAKRSRKKPPAEPKPKMPHTRTVPRRQVSGEKKPPTPVKQEPIPEKQEPIPDDTATLVRLEDLERFHCRWIEGPVAGENTLFCGAHKIPGSSYCRHHSKILSKVAA